MGDGRERDEIEASLLKKGFVKKDGGDHHRYIYFTGDGQKTSVHTKISRGSKSRHIDTSLIALMARQCRLAKADFLQLVDCPLSRDGYAQKLAQQGVG